MQKQLTSCNSTTRSDLYSALGRVYLQLGDVVRAQQSFNSAADLRDKSLTKNVILSLVDAGLVAVAQNSFSEAYGYYKQALAMEPNNPLVICLN